MDDPAQDRLPRCPTASFLRLPLELRNIVYEILIHEATLVTSAPALGISVEFELQISTKKIKYSNLRLPSNLIYTSHQIYSESSILICSCIHHMRLTGDFLMGLSSTDAIFKMLELRPWIANSIRKVNIQLKVNHVLLVFGGFAMNRTVLERHPWLGERFRIAELKVSLFEKKSCGVKVAPQGWWHLVRSGRGLRWCLQRLGMEILVEEEAGDRRADIEQGNEHNTLPDLARLFENFGLLERIDIETEHRNLLSLFPAPQDTAESFRICDRRGVEANVFVKHWQMQSFRNMLYRNGVERGSIRFGDGSAKGKMAVTYETRPAGDRIVSFRLLDCVVRANKQ